MILERDAELAELARLVDETESSGGRVVLVRGEAGIGKSTLINWFLSEVEDRVGARNSIVASDQHIRALERTLKACPSGPNSALKYDRRHSRSRYRPCTL